MPSRMETVSQLIYDMCHNDASIALEYSNSFAAPLLVKFAGAKNLMTTLNMRTLHEAGCNTER